MRLYELDMNIKYGDGYLSLKNDRISTGNNMIFINDLEFPKFSRAIGKSDILRTINYNFLFSRKLKDELSYFDDFIFTPVLIEYDNKVNTDYFLVTLTKKFCCVDLDNSSITGNPFFDEIIFLLDKIPSSTLAFTPESGYNHSLYTNNFIEIINREHFDVEYNEITT